MIQLDDFVGMMTGHFDNKEQFDMMQATGKRLICMVCMSFWQRTMI